MVKFGNKTNQKVNALMLILSIRHLKPSPIRGEKRKSPIRLCLLIYVVPPITHNSQGTKNLAIPI
jgi:hypothetical protein